MKSKIIPRSDYEVYFIAEGKKRPGKKAIREALRARHPFFTSDSAMSRESCVIAGKRFEMVTVFAEPRSMTEQIFGTRRRTQTQTLLARFAHESPCTVRSSGELLILKETPESIRQSGQSDDPDEAMQADHTITEIIDERNALTDLLARGTPLLAIAAFLPVAFAIACATIGHSRGQNADLQESERTKTVSSQSGSEPAHEPLDFFSCLKEDIDAVNESRGTIESYLYDGQKNIKVSMKISGGKIAKLGESLKKIESISDISMPSVSFTKGYPEYAVCTVRNDGLERPTSALDWTKAQILQEACGKAGIKIERMTMSPYTECALSMEMQALSRCISLLVNFCDRESIGIKSCSLNSGSTCAVTVSFAERTEPRKTDGPDAESIGRAFRQSEKHAEKKKTDRLPVIGRISEGGKKPVTFRKNGTGKITDEGGFE